METESHELQAPRKTCFCPSSQSPEVFHKKTPETHLPKPSQYRRGSPSSSMTTRAGMATMRTSLARVGEGCQRGHSTPCRQGFGTDRARHTRRKRGGNLKAAHHTEGDGSIGLGHGVRQESDRGQIRKVLESEKSSADASCCNAGRTKCRSACSANMTPS